MMLCLSPSRRHFALFQLSSHNSLSLHSPRLHFQLFYHGGPFGCSPQGGPARARGGWRNGRRRLSTSRCSPRSSRPGTWERKVSADRSACEESFAGVHERSLGSSAHGKALAYPLLSEPLLSPCLGHPRQARKEYILPKGIFLIPLRSRSFSGEGAQDPAPAPAVRDADERNRWPSSLPSRRIIMSDGAAPGRRIRRVLSQLLQCRGSVCGVVIERR